MVASFVVYIDESGDEGFIFNNGSSEWFVLSAVVTRKVNDLSEVKVVDSVRNELYKPINKPLHFRNLKHNQRLLYVKKISEAKIRTVSVIIHKPSINEPEKFHERYRLYFFTARLLLERVSWLCRDNKKSIDPGDGSAEIIFSNRSGMSYKDLKDYLNLLDSYTGAFDIRIDWSVIKPTQIKEYHTT